MLKILIAEDERYARESLAKQIRSCAGEEVVLYMAANGKEGWEQYQEFSPDLVMTDVRMPVMDGLALLRRIRTEDVRTPVIIISAYSDFEYAREALSVGASEYLLKPVEEEALRRCLQRFLPGELPAAGNPSPRQNGTGRDPVSRYILASVRSDAPSGIGEKLFEKTFPFYQITALWIRTGGGERARLNGIIQELLREEESGNARVLETDGRIPILILAEDDRYFIQRKLRLRLREQGLRVCMGISGMHSDAKEIRAAYLEALGALKYKIYGRDFTAWEQMQSAEMRTGGLLPQEEEALCGAMREGDELRGGEILRSVMRRFAGSPPIRIESLELLYSRLLLLFAGAAGDPAAVRYFLNLPQGILRFDTLEEVEQFLLENMRLLCRGEGGTADGKREKDIVRAMELYAQQHYDGELSVKMLAENVLFMNSDYLSHLFASRRGIHFSSYVREIRMQKAKELLRESSYPVRDIAVMTGYNDVSQFIRVFRRECGVTPGKYREENRKNPGIDE